MVLAMMAMAMARMTGKRGQSDQEPKEDKGGKRRVAGSRVCLWDEAWR